MSKSGTLVSSSVASERLGYNPTSSGLREYADQLVFQPPRYGAMRKVFDVFPILLLQQEL